MRLFAFALALSLAMLLGSSPAFAQADEDRYVVIISIDGFPADALWNPRLPLPAIRSLATEGAWANAMIPSTPSVTWPNHTTLVTGVHPAKHGMMANGAFIRTGAGQPVYIQNDLDRAELSTYPTLYDRAFKAGLRTAEVNWPVTRRAETLHDSFPDAVASVATTTPRLRSELVSLGVLPDETDESFRRISPVGRDRVWTSAAVHLIRTRQPNLLLLHLLNVDGTHHAHGPGSNAGFTALAHADTHVREILDALEEAGIRERTTVMIVSDHGFMRVTSRIHPNILLRENGLLEVNDAGQITGARVQVVPIGGSAMVFATSPATRDEDLRVARSLFTGAEGIDRVLEPPQYAALGLPHPSVNHQVGDLVLSAAEGYAFHNAAAGTPYAVRLAGAIGTHGYINTVPQMETLFVASGRGIRPGVELGTIDNRSVAPTAARLLGFTLDSADGEVLEAILE